MSEKIVVDTVSLHTIKCWCGVLFAVSETLTYEYENRDHVLHCPMGHEFKRRGESEADKLRKQLAAKQASLDQAWATVSGVREEKAAVERRLSATQGVVTRTKRRIAHGVCPCCKRTFQALARHMKSQHPEYEKGAQP